MNKKLKHGFRLPPFWQAPCNVLADLSNGMVLIVSGCLWKRLQATQFYEAIELCLAVNVWCFVEPISSLK
jgi:hypothetical protein